MPLDRRTRATFRRAELGFLGVMILTCRHTPFFCGQPCMAGCFGRLRCTTRGLRTNWLMVGIGRSSSHGVRSHARRDAPVGLFRSGKTFTLVFRRRGVKGALEKG